MSSRGLVLSVLLLPAISLASPGERGGDRRYIGIPQWVEVPVEIANHRPFPQRVAYVPGTLVPSRSRPEREDDVRVLYDLWMERYRVFMGEADDGHPRYRIRKDRGARDATVSEGQGWGMMLAAFMAGHDPQARTVFDGLWEFALDHRSAGDPRLMDWWVNWDESPDGFGDNSAFDGDADIAYGLLLAEAQWGNRGRFDYGAEAEAVLAGILASAMGPDSDLPMLGDWVGPHGSPHNQWTPRGSDFMVDHFWAFSRASGDPRWGDVREACLAAIEQMQRDYSPHTGLVPDFMVARGSGPDLEPAWPYFLESAWDGAHFYNACRLPWRLGLDALISGDERTLASARAMARWISAATGDDPWEIRAGYQLSGAPVDGSAYFTSAFAAPFAVALMTDPGQQDFLDSLYEVLRTRDESYYADSISLFSMIVLSGTWWSPGAGMGAEPQAPRAWR